VRGRGRCGAPNGSNCCSVVTVTRLDAHRNFDELAAPGGNVDHVSIVFNAGHPGVAEPHYHVVLWHVSKAEEKLVAK
jgi:hypothetical protein